MKRIVRACVCRVTAWLDRAEGQELERVSAEQIGHAVRILRGARYARRKRQRKRKHVTYKQRDAIADLLIRLQKERRNQPMMTRDDWVSHFVEYATGMSDYLPDDIQAAAEARATEQRDNTGSDDADMWQSPMAAAQKQLNEWHRENEEAAEVPPGEVQPVTPTPETNDPKPETPEAPQEAPSDAPATKAQWVEPTT